MYKGDCKWHHDYVRLAFDTGFKFERHKSDDSDRNKISLIDVDRVIEERDFATVEKLIPGITKFILDPDQAQILDVSFVKTFKLSQLAIQYLLFCKKYLDNTVILLKDEVKKIREENKELNLFVDDLKDHISTLMREIDEKVAFKCEQCNKVFSSEEFLNSHIKRRHSVPIQDPETDKLQMEIKELKGRLNDAEKKIHKEHHETDSNISRESEFKKIEDLQQKFEDLRLQVQSELKILQTQHNFQEKYEKWFERMAFQGGSLGRRRESMTQTDLGVEEGTSNRVVIYEEKNKENVPELTNAQKQITQFEAVLETKMTSSLQKIEDQMQSFWNKLSEMEMYRSTVVEENPKPSIKPRSKYFVKKLDETRHRNDSSQQRDKKHAKNVPLEEAKEEEITDSSPQCDISRNQEISKVPSIKVMKAQPQIKVSKIKTEKIESGINLTEIDDDTTTSETLASEEKISESPKEKVFKPPLKPPPVPRKRPKTSKEDVSGYVIDDELLQHFKLEIENIIKTRLQDLGVSPDWNGLPNRSYQRALEIINHQANLTYSNFDSIASKIEKDVARQIDAKHQPKKFVKAKPKKTKVSAQIEIKNRQMYDTDSESEIKPIKVNEKQFSAPYSAVIAELKTVTSKIDASDKSDSSIKEEKRVKEDHTKGVLKSYPSVGSLTKKKVLFNLDTEEKKELPSKDGGSTTSITSSVFDATPRNDETKKRNKDIEDLSDFDFSDM
ncbi:zinc finger protein DZIP1 isoform X2 [Tribolium madens]|uniref:zinc finger protein DZIP1 isoform X2 n=1 Tax=Tribolium madens TaxID=41895 RepID=UPI001CF723EB|nr:zinc finger protein DZIP1 isoform X2 [Tribolium madens]